MNIELTAEEAKALKTALAQGIQTAKENRKSFADLSAEYRAGSNKAEHYAGLAIDQRVQAERLSNILTKLHVTPGSEVW